MDVMLETAQMTDTAISFARGVSQVRTPEHLVPLRVK